MIVYTLRDADHAPIEAFDDLASAGRALNTSFLAHHLHPETTHTSRLELLVTAGIYEGDVGDILIWRADGGRSDVITESGDWMR